MKMFKSSQAVPLFNNLYSVVLYLMLSMGPLGYSIWCVYKNSYDLLFVIAIPTFVIGLLLALIHLVLYLDKNEENEKRREQ